MYTRSSPAGGFGLALATAVGIDVKPAEADADIASNSQLKGQYAGTSSGGCLVALSGFDQNNRPIDRTTSYSNLGSNEVVFTFDGSGRGNANFITSVTIIVPGPNPSPVPSVGLSTGGGNFTYSVGPKHTVPVTLTNPAFKALNGPSAGLTSVIDEVVLEGHFGPYGMTLVQTDGAVETITPPTGSPIPRICERAFVLLSSRERF
jgi:hypothetical protein